MRVPTCFTKFGLYQTPSGLFKAEQYECLNSCEQRAYTTHTYETFLELIYTNKVEFIFTFSSNPYVYIAMILYAV